MELKRNKMGLNRFEKIKTNNIKTPNWRFKNVDKSNYTKLRASIFKHGQNQNIIVRKTNDNFEIIDGRMVFEILKEKGANEIFCFVYCDADEIDAQLIYLESDFYFENNFVEVAASLVKIFEKYKKTEVERTIKHNHKEIEDLLKLNKFDFEKYKLKKPIENLKLF